MEIIFIFILKIINTYLQHFAKSQIQNSNILIIVCIQIIGMILISPGLVTPTALVIMMEQKNQLQQSMAFL